MVPPPRGASPQRVEESLGLVARILEACRPDAVNVPEILGSGFQGMDPLEFALRIQERHDVDLIVNKVVVHAPASELDAWLRRAIDAEVASAILVGGERSGIYYPGPNVTQANRMARALAAETGRPGFLVGNVTLPTRAHEGARMLEKANAGCDYFTSQIVYEFASANVHLQAYDDLCALVGVAPKPILYAFSPADTEQDVRFLRYLGVHVPPHVERALLDAARPGESLRIIEDVWGQLVAAARSRGVRVPLGAVVETVTRRHAEDVGRLMERLRRRLVEPVARAPA